MNYSWSRILFGGFFFPPDCTGVALRNHKDTEQTVQMDKRMPEHYIKWALYWFQVKDIWSWQSTKIHLRSTMISQTHISGATTKYGLLQLVSTFFDSVMKWMRPWRTPPGQEVIAILAINHKNVWRKIPQLHTSADVLSLQLSMRVLRINLPQLKPSSSTQQSSE